MKFETEDRICFHDFSNPRDPQFSNSNPNSRDKKIIPTLEILRFLTPTPGTKNASRLRLRLQGQKKLFWLRLFPTLTPGAKMLSDSDSKSPLFSYSDPDSRDSRNQNAFRLSRRGSLFSYHDSDSIIL